MRHAGITEPPRRYEAGDFLTACLMFADLIWWRIMKRCPTDTE